MSGVGSIFIANCGIKASKVQPLEEAPVLSCVRILLALRSNMIIEPYRATARFLIMHAGPIYNLLLDLHEDVLINRAINFNSPSIVPNTP